MPAEWEPHRATWIAWPHFEADWPGKLAPIPWVYGEIARALADFEPVEILCHSESIYENAGAILESHAVRADRVRLHVVSHSANPLLWSLLKAFGEKAPAPLLVNTSFNLFGEPLVVTPRDAVRSYFCSGTDALVIGNFVLSKF